MGRKVVYWMDTQTERAVWQRVRGPGGMTAEEAVLPERLEALILEQRVDAAELRALSGSLRGQGRAALNRLANRAEARAGELTTLHYLLTGRQLRLRAPKPQRPGPLPEALRQACLRSRQNERSFAALGGEFSDYASDFSRFSREAKDQTGTLMQLLQTAVRAQGPRRSSELR